MPVPRADMQTVPSLIGTGTAVAAAATGFVFGQLDDDQPPPSSPRSNPNKRKLRPEDLDLSASAPWPAVVVGEAAAVAEPVSPRSPPNNQDTAEQLRLPQSLLSPLISPRFQNLRHSWARQFDLGGAPIAEDSCDSVSSNGSWIRRLSLRPLSQHESVKSSSAPDSQSMFSHGSAAPILSPTVVTAPQLPPNKLVKRSSTKDGANLGPPAKRSSRSQIPTLRRPATSHQRSATLHRLSIEEAVPPIPEPPIRQSSIGRTLRPRAQTVAAVPNSSPVAEFPPADNSRWKSFFHARIVRIAIKVSSSKRSESTAQHSAKRICAQKEIRHQPYLINPRFMMAGSDASEVYPAHEPAQTSTGPDGSPQSSAHTNPTPDETPSKTPRRSISMQFSSKANWLSKPGSIRRRKRGASGNAAGNTKRAVSDPVTYEVQPGQAHTAEMAGTAAIQTRAGGPSRVESELTAIFKPPSRSASSPVPPLSIISSFRFDLNRLSSAGSQGKSDEPPSAGYSTSALRVNSSASQARTLDRASTVGSSEYHRGFMSGDDDDTDNKTDTPFDSIRTAGSERRKTLDSPLEFMFDESPTSSSGNVKQPKRLSIQEILGPGFDGGNQIMEEDEGLQTPIRGTYDDAEAHFQMANFEDEKDFNSSVSSGLNLANKDFGRLSLDDDDDVDWTRDDEEEIYNHLSPPSSMNSRRESPNQRTALTIISGNGGRDSYRDVADDRPRSNIFDWADPAFHDKPEVEGHSLRPRTVHGKREMDIRGGRSASRRGPIAAHVRSQSVPIVHDPTDSTKTTPKFGTWGSKNVSEDWDDDFEFDEEADVSRAEGKRSEKYLSMIVPASIQATQPTVMAHSGQIRELSLLVNDLKRLCRLGREMGMLDGPLARLWRDAEGIIALASPDDDELDDDLPSPVAEDFDLNLIDERFLDEGFDGGALDHANPTSMAHEPLKTSVIKERTQVRRRSVFSPEDDIFGNWPSADDDDTTQEQPRTPDTKRPSSYNPSSVARSLMESMHLRHVLPSDATDDQEEESTGRLNFDTNSLKELVKRASDLRDSLSDLVRKADHITHSPACTPSRQRPARKEDDSPAFTRVFDDPASTPTRQIPHSRSSNSMLSNGSVAASPNGLSQRLQVMTVS